MELAEIRKEIDEIDQDLIKLLEKRMDCVSRVLAAKKSSGQEVVDKEREAVVLARVASLVTKPDYQETILATFADIMRQSSNYQQSKLS
ncbi:chorismate mutase [Streptococcus oricebi]|uniref:Chorismate mutase n=1 Tax=Streptococcus oricebi TaxID=1547447 RepID=A0ABS5B0S6_9STRE|nr:chorismate mutase [Streptococcus oricebi]MBP2622437.1 chorismate mutase [Streptococcus oricebi]